MNENVQIAIGVIILVVGAMYMYHIYQTSQSQLQPNRDIYVNQNFISINYSPATTNIENIEGCGHTIGNENKVQNEVD